MSIQEERTIMSRPLSIIALLLAVVGAIFLFAAIGGDTALYLFVGALILHIIGTLTGK